MIKIEEIKNSDKKPMITERILRSLPDWFEIEQGVLDYIQSVRELVFFVAKIENNTVGFIAIEDFNEFSSEIHVMGVLPKFRGQGIGRLLIEKVWDRNESLGRKYLTVKTLDESANDKYYDQTRKFYSAMSFTPVMMSKDIWGEDNPCLIMIKSA